MAGAGGDSGKTLVSIGLAAAWRDAGLDVSAFKKGPDYIDAAWLSRAAGRPARNLDAWLMGEEEVRHSLMRHASGADVCVIEGNRGVLDGLDGHSTAALARTLDAPLVLVLDVTKTTRTPAAFVVGVGVLEPDLRLAGVILNRVRGARHTREARDAVERTAGVPVLGAIPGLDDRELLPARHLGLVPPEEHARREEIVKKLGGLLFEHVDMDGLLELSRTAGPLPAAPPYPPPAAPRARIGVFRDAAFTFYYPENIEALQQAGAEVVSVSSLEDEGLPGIDLLYIGGGFPETHAEALGGNAGMLRSVARAARAGLPIYAECGGLVYLARSVTFRGRRAPLSGVLEMDVTVHERPQGHGYVDVLVDGQNPFFSPGTVLRGHEFHYSAITSGAAGLDYVFDMRRGTGSHLGRDGICAGGVLASFLHVHASGTPEWAPALVRRAMACAQGMRAKERMEWAS